LTKAQTMHKVQYENEKRMYKKMMTAVSKTEDEINKLKNSNKNKQSNNSGSSGLTGYVAAGLLVAAASVGVALFARYKNLI
jgi:hypothetical protein